MATTLRKARGGRARPAHPGDPAATEARGRSQGSADAGGAALFNQQRAEHGLAPLKADARLGQAADAHSADMLRHGYFAHDDAHGTWDDRIRRYVTRREVGEILAFGTGRVRNAYGNGARPGCRVRSTAASFSRPGLRRVGLGVVTGTFEGQDSVSLTTADFSSAA